MKASERDPVLYLEDIALSMHRVQEYITGLDFDHFKVDYKTIDAVIRNFEIIGEASKNLPKTIRINILPSPGSKCIVSETEFPTNISGSIMKLFGI